MNVVGIMSADPAQLTKMFQCQWINLQIVGQACRGGTVVYFMRVISLLCP